MGLSKDIYLESNHLYDAVYKRPKTFPPIQIFILHPKPFFTNRIGLKPYLYPSSQTLNLFLSSRRCNKSSGQKPSFIPKLPLISPPPAIPSSRSFPFEHASQALTSPPFPQQSFIPNRSILSHEAKSIRQTLLPVRTTCFL